MSKTERSLVVTSHEYDCILWALNEWATSLNAQLRKPDDHLHSARRERVSELQRLASKLQKQGGPIYADS